MDTDHGIYMARAIQLARLAGKRVKSNPQVGAVLVYRDRVIGEGYHQQYGGPHAEVNCVNTVALDDRKYIAQSTLYVTLEPCHHYGKTPPCVDLVIDHGISAVIIGTADPNPQVAGQSVNKLRNHGIEVIEGVMQEECKALIAPFVKMLQERKPWITLKLAKSKYNYMAAPRSQVWLSNSLSKIYVHRLRAEVDGVLIGTRTALIDNPSLTTREVDGLSPTRIVLDRTASLPTDLSLFDGQAPTIYVSEQVRDLPKGVTIIQLDFNAPLFWTDLLQALYKRGIYRLMIEGGATLLRSIVNAELWDDAIVIHTPHQLKEGKKAPNLTGMMTNQMAFGDDTIYHIRNYANFSSSEVF